MPTINRYTAASIARHLAKSFKHTGNDSVTLRLNDVANDMEESVATVVREHGEALRASINADQKAFNDTILTALFGRGQIIETPGEA